MNVAKPLTNQGDTLEGRALALAAAIKDLDWPPRHKFCPQSMPDEPVRWCYSCRWIHRLAKKLSAFAQAEVERATANIREEASRFRLLYEGALQRAVDSEEKLERLRFVAGFVLHHLDSNPQLASTLSEAIND